MKTRCRARICSPRAIRTTCICWCWCSSACSGLALLGFLLYTQWRCARRLAGRIGRSARVRIGGHHRARGAVQLHAHRSHREHVLRVDVRAAVRRAAQNAMKLSVVVITKNEEAVIARCLESVAWADEIVVVDSGSTDRTVDICRGLGAKVHVTPDWPGPGPQRNRGIDLSARRLDPGAGRGRVGDRRRCATRSRVCCKACPSRWRIACRVCRAIAAATCATAAGGRTTSRACSSAGQRAFGGGIVHDHLIVEGPVGTLRDHLLHEAFTDLDEVLGKLNSYSTWGAQTLHEQGTLGRDRQRGGAWALDVRAHLPAARRVSSTGAKASCSRCPTPKARTTST